MKILIVDDSEISLEIQKSMIEGCGLSAEAAESGSMAVSMCAENKYDMVLMDINMPEMNGYEAAEIIRRNDHDVPIIALSADEIDKNSEVYKKSGMSGSLIKPLKMDELKELLNKFEISDFVITDKPADKEVVFAYKELLSILHDKKSVINILERFISVHNRDCELLAEEVMAGNYLGARKIIHNIKGISGNLFCHRLYTAARILNGELRMERADSLESFKATWNETISELSACYEKLTSSKKSKKKASADWDEVRKNFILLCHDFDVETADVFTENMDLFMEKMDPDSFKLLKKAVFSYDFLWINEKYYSEWS